MKIASIIALVVTVLLWVMTIRGLTGSKEGQIMAYFLKYPAILSTVITVLMLLIMAFKR